MVQPGGELRATARAVYPAMASMSSQDVRSHSDSLGATFLDRSLTFDLARLTLEEHPFPIDVVPRVIAAPADLPG